MLFSITLLSLAFLLILVSLILQKFSSRRKGYWKQRGIPEIDVSSIATELDVLLGQKDITDRDDYAYKIMESEQMSFCGFVESPTPVILVKDIEIIKKVLIKDFEYFVDRRLFFGAARDDSVLRKMLGNLQGDEWKGVRSSVTPTFTTGKIRNMMSHINTVGTQWVKHLSIECQNGPLKINVFNRVRQYTADVIASAIFGLDAASVQNPNSVFSTMARRLTDMNTFQVIKFTLSLRFPKIFQFFNIDILDMEALRFFETLLKDKLKQRMEQDGNGPQKCNDFLQLLVDVKRGKLRRAAVEELSSFEKEAELPQGKITNKLDYLTDHVMSGQCLSFFFAGFRTTSHFITFALYALALHPEVQSKLREEVEQIFKEEDKDGHLDYDQLGSLVHMDMVVCEILRKYPGALRLERTCVSDYHDKETGLRVPQGTIVAVPVHSIHNDKRFYERPDDFYPEHFHPEKKAERTPYAFLPFGAGKRNCIGIRFALVESKAILAHIVHNFIIQPTEKTPMPLTGRRANSLISPPLDLELALTPR